MSLGAALQEMHERLKAQGSKAQPKEGTKEWFILRADALGELLLQCMKKQGVEGNPQAAEACYKNALKALKWNDNPN